MLTASTAAEQAVSAESQGGLTERLRSIDELFAVAKYESFDSGSNQLTYAKSNKVQPKQNNIYLG
jgi:hypothetical protein